MSTSTRPISEVAAGIGIPADDLIPYGVHFAKVRLSNPTPETPTPGKLILVTAITPTNHGEGKTVTTIGLAQAIRKLGKKAIATVRQPSMGPVFGLKGGAAGGGLSKVVPSDLINLHFTGDFHAISSAHNLLSAMVDAHVFHGNESKLALDQIVWPRTMDMNDRALRRITVAEGKSNGTPHPSGFVITAASEIMAIFALATSYDDLRERLMRIIVGFDTGGNPVPACRFHTVGAMMVLLRDALQPNLAQTTDGTPAFVHAGPFANIAHGTASVVSQRMALRLADFVVNEAGFGSDLGAEKYFDIVMPASGLKPSAAVVVATVRALAAQGVGDLAAGLVNLGRHLEIVKGFGVPAVVAINRFPDDSAEDLRTLQQFCADHGAESALSEVFAKGADGGLDLAAKVMTAAGSGSGRPESLYAPDTPLDQKIETVATRVYGADGVKFSDNARAKVEAFTALGYGSFPVCIAKTPLSFTDDPKRLGAPTGWTLPISDLVLSAGAGFAVAIAGTTVRMPGLGKSPQAMRMDVNAEGEFVGVS